VSDAPPPAPPVYVPDRRYLVCNLIALAVAALAAVPALFLPRNAVTDPSRSDGKAVIASEVRR